MPDLLIELRSEEIPARMQRKAAGDLRKAVTDAPWRDTVLVARDEKVRIAFIADNPGKWLFHCHMLEHQAAGMVTWIVVT